MAMKGNLLLEKCNFGVAVVPQSVSNTTVNGATILEPWRKGRQLVFIFLGGVFAASGNLTIKVQVRDRAAGTWANVKDAKGTNDLEVTPTRIDDTGPLENGAPAGTIEMDLFNAATQDAVRLTVQESATAACLVAVAYIIYDVYEKPVNNTDELLSRSRFGT